MRRVALLFLFTILYSVAYCQVKMVRFKTSKPYNILNFLETAAGQGYYATTLKKHIEASNLYNDTSFQKLLSGFNNLNLNYSYKIEGYPSNRNQYRSTYELLTIAAVQSNSLSTFQERTVGILPNSELEKLFRVLTSAEKHYDKLIWNDHESKIKKQMQALEKYQSQSSTLFQLFKNFYHSSWSDQIPFTIALYPIPGTKGHSTATPHANSLCLGVFSDESTHTERISVVLHEICHVLYQEQTSSFQHQLDSVFMKSESPYRKLAYSYLDEALATALGNGWAYKYLNNKLDTSAWYDNKYINGFGHAIFPLVDQYLNSRKKMDVNFVNQAIRIFGETFPQSLSDYNILLSNVFVYADFETAAERNKFKNSIGNYFQVSRSNLSSPILHEYSIEALKNTQETQLIIINRNHKENIAKLKTLFPVIDNYLKGKPPEAYILSFFDANKRPVIIINVNGLESLNKAFAKMSALQYINMNLPFIAVE